MHPKKRVHASTRQCGGSTRWRWTLCTHPPFLGLHACNKMGSMCVITPVLYVIRPVLPRKKNYMKRGWQTDFASLWKNRPGADSLKISRLVYGVWCMVYGFFCPFERRQLIVYCLLATVYCLLSTINCHLSTVFCPLSSVYTIDFYCLLLNGNCQLSTVYCLLSTVYCLMSTVYCLLSTVYCLLSNVYCVLSTVYCHCLCFIMICVSSYLEKR